MRSYVKKPADPAGYEIPEELRNHSVSAEEVMELIRTMAAGLGETEEIAVYEENACIRCADVNGKPVLLFPDLMLPGAELPEDVKNVRKGERLTIILNGAEKTVTAEGIFVKREAPVDDALGRKAGYDTDTLEGLTALVKEEEEARLYEGHVKELAGALFAYLAEASELVIDEEELRAWATEAGAQVFNEELAMGIDLRFTEDGDMLTEEEAIANLAEEYKSQFPGMVVTESICKADGYEPDADMIREQLAMQGVEEADASLMESMLMNDRMGYVFDKLTAYAGEVLK